MYNNKNKYKSKGTTILLFTVLYNFTEHILEIPININLVKKLNGEEYKKDNRIK